MWWRDGLLYQVYPRSFADSDGDGIGDLRGITARLDHLEWLGVDGLWLNPTFPSPNADWGFDVSDYRGRAPRAGDARGPRRARGARGRARDPGAARPRPQPHQRPAPVVPRAPRLLRLARGPQRRAAQQLEEHLRRAGVDARRGQRRVVPAQLHPRAARPRLVERGRARRVRRHPALLDGPRASRASGSTWRTGSSRTPSCATTRPPPTTTSTTTAGSASAWSTRPTARRSTTSSAAGARWSTRTRRCWWARRGCSTCTSSCASTARTSTSCTWPSTSSSCSRTSRRRSSRAIVAETEALLPEHAWPVWTLGNHDMDRFPTRWTRGDPGLARCALMLLLTLRGTPVLYYGDELALPNAEIAPGRIVDPVGLRNDPEFPGRDGARSPMPWTDEPGAGFTTPDAEPWLPFGELAGVNVAAQRADPGSPLNLTRDLVALRRAEEDLRTGAYAEVAVDEGLWAYRRGDSMLVALNLGSRRRDHRGRGHDRDRHPPPARRRGDHGVAAAGARRGRRRAAGIAADYGGVRGRGRCTRLIEGKEAGGRRGACGCAGGSVRDSSDA